MKPSAPALPPKEDSPVESSEDLQLSPVQIQARLTHLSEVLGRRLDSYKTYAQTAGFGVKIGGKTCFDHDHTCVVLSSQELLETERPITLVDFDVYHELGHLIQLFEDPRGYQKLIDSSVREDGLGKIYFEFYNCLLDVGVNSRIGNSFQTYQGPAGTEYSEQIRNYYRKDLFSVRDLTNEPLSRQFSYYLLNLGMGVADDLVLSEAVQAEITQTIRYIGKDISVEDFLNANIKTQVRGSNQAGQPVGYQKRLIDKYLLPIFERLLEIDKKNGTDLEAKEDHRDKTTFSHSDLSNIIKTATGFQDHRNMNAKDRAAGVGCSQVKNSLPNDTPPELADEFAKNLAAVRPEIIALSNLWRRFRVTKSAVTIEETAGHKYGHDLSVDDAIGQFLEISQQPDSAAVMLSNEHQEVLSNQPKKIGLFLLLDLSGSMTQLTPQLKQLMLAMSGSVVSFNESSKGVGLDTRMELSIIGYNDNGVVLMDSGDTEVFSDLIQAYQKLVCSNGTQSHQGLAVVRDLVKSKLAAFTDKSDYLALCTEMTDGDTSEPITSASIIQELTALGVSCTGIRFYGNQALDVPLHNTHDPMLDPDQKLTPEEVTILNQNAYHSLDLMYGEQARTINRIQDLPAAIFEAYSSLIPDQQ
jgi:hypothetical protein